MSDDGARVVVHDALQGFLDPGAIVVSWVVTIEVVGPDGVRYLAHRHGGGHDGRDVPTTWAVAGMLESARICTHEQFHHIDPDESEDEDFPSAD